MDCGEGQGGVEGKITNEIEEVFGPDCGDGFTVMNVSKLIGFYTLNRHNLGYINCTSINLQAFCLFVCVFKS